MTDAIDAILDGKSLQDLHKEIMLLHGILATCDGYTLRVDLYVREWAPGVLIKLAPPELGAFGPGWSWYISDRPDRTYWARGGGCFFDDARAAAELEVSSVMLERAS